MPLSVTAVLFSTSEVIDFSREKYRNWSSLMLLLSAMIVPMRKRRAVSLERLVVDLRAHVIDAGDLFLRAIGVKPFGDHEILAAAVLSFIAVSLAAASCSALRAASPLNGGSGL